MNDLKSQLIKMGASLLRYRPSTIREDFPNVPAYYRKSVDVYHERGRRAAILMCKAHDQIRDDANKITAMEAERKELVKRVRHASWCLGVPNGIGKHPCTCGLDELLSEQEHGYG